MSDRIYYSREAEERANRERTAAVLVFLALGLVVGTAIALLFAPNPGSKTRRELGGAVEGTFGESLEGAAATVKRLEKEFSELRRRVEDRIDDLR